MIPSPCPHACHICSPPPPPPYPISPPLPVQHVLIHQHGTSWLGAHHHPGVCGRVKEQGLGIVVPVQGGGREEGHTTCGARERGEERARPVGRVRGVDEERSHRDNKKTLAPLAPSAGQHHPSTLFTLSSTPGPAGVEVQQQAEEERLARLLKRRKGGGRREGCNCGAPACQAPEERERGREERGM